MTTAKPVHQILDDAADLLADESRWFQGDYYVPCPTDEAGVSFCADGALQAAAGIVSNFRVENGELHYDYLSPYSEEGTPVHEAYGQAYLAASDYTREKLAFHSGGIIGYNDANDRKHAEVIAALRGAANLERERARELVAA